MTAPKTIICYCGGGLGNRLMPLASCWAMAQLTGRRLLALWRDDDRRCQVGFNDLFTPPVEKISDEQLAGLSDCTIYADLKDVYENFYLTRQESLIKLIEAWGIHDRNQVKLDDCAPHVIFYHNAFMSGIDPEFSRAFIRRLAPVPPLRQRIDQWAARLQIGPGTMGVHARGTDFHVSVAQYAEKIQQVIAKNPAQRFLVCSDDLAYEEALAERFARNVIIRPKADHVRRADQRATWINNLITSRAAVEEAVVDIFLLARTDFKIFHAGSSFARLARMVTPDG